MTNQELNRTVGKKFFAEQDRLRGGPAPELCTSDYSACIGGGPAVDRAGHEGFAKGFYAMVPDARHEVEQVLVEGDGAAVRFVIRGTHVSGKRIEVAGHVLLTLADGRVRKLVALFDEAGMLRQIGVLPAG